MSSEGNLVKAIYSFKGKNNDELCFKKGDVITVTQREEGGWWEGTLGETTGWFPSNYVTECKDANGSLTTSPVRAPSEIQAFRNVVLKDIIDSEKAHVAEMQGLLNNFLEPLEKSDILTRDEFKQLTGNIREVLQTHEQLLALVEECGAKTGPEQRVGGLFLQWAPRVKAVHQTYCAGHPRAVCILDKYKDELNTWMERAGAVCPGVLVLTAGLSKPFRRLSKFPAMLQELARHVHEAHPDRGDTHRASVVYKDIASECAALRRQKELELQVVTGSVRGWTGGPLSALGEVLHMGGVAVGAAHADRYLVLFPSALLLLSVSKRVSAFVYEGCLPLTGISVAKLDDTDMRKNAFEISGPMIDTIVAVCQTKAEADNWVNLLQKHSNPGSLSINEANQPQSLPHLRRSPSEGALSSFNSSRRSLYHVTLPPESYPPASPYHSLTKYFAELVRLKVITRPMLRKLLHERPWARAMEMAGVPVRRRNKNRTKLREDDDGDVETESEYSESEYSESEATESYAGSSTCDDARIFRQDALDRSTLRTDSTPSSSGDPDFRYLRYFNSSSECLDLSHSYAGTRGDCTKDIFESASIPEIFQRPPDPTICVKMEPYVHPSMLSMRNPNFGLSNQSSEDSSFEVGQAKPYMACEDLVNIDEDAQIETLGSQGVSFESRRSCPTDCGDSRLRAESHLKLWKSAEENPISRGDGGARASVSSESQVTSEMVEALDPPGLHASNSYRERCYGRDVMNDLARIILDPPPMFQNDKDNNKVVLKFNQLTNIPFRNHSINSDKKIRRSISKSLIEYGGSDSPTDCSDRQQTENNNRFSVNSDHGKMIKHCACCDASRCQSPRSSDSGVVGSCNLASPELPNMPDYTAHPDSQPSSDLVTRINQKKLSRNGGQIRSEDELLDSQYDQMEPRGKLTLSEIEAAKFEEQCRCTSPFGSTPRTSCQPSLTSENVVVGGLDSMRTSVTSTYLESLPLSTSRTGQSEIKRTSFRADVNQHLVQGAPSKMPTTENNNGQSGGAINHKRSHSFNNHHSYTQHVQQEQPTQSNRQKQSARWLLNSCDSLSQPSGKHSIGAKFSSLDFIDTAGVNFTTKGWSISSLRPAPPLRPQFLVGSEENLGPTHPYAPHQRKSNSYEEDALILRVIEAYCTSARCRNAVSSECDEERQSTLDALVRSPSLPVSSGSGAGPAGLYSLVMRLQNEVKTLKFDLKHLQMQLSEERQERNLAIATLKLNVLKEPKEGEC